MTPPPSIAPQVYPVEEPEPAGLIAGTRLRPYQKQSLAFMLAAEKKDRAAASSSSSQLGKQHLKQHLGPAASQALQGGFDHQRPHGGWLADEVPPHFLHHHRRLLRLLLPYSYVCRWAWARRWW